MSSRSPLLALAFAASLLGCKSRPLPAEKAEYAGHWRGGGIDLVITQDGGVSYNRIKGAGHVEINGPIKGFDGDDFVVGVMVVKTTFDVTAPPHEAGGAWKMTVDGVELTRVAQ
ncbi:MAG: hypothetical protein IAG13_36400 [Deltaproteobacteria bacterium]|nr:hypothetical protein [Nannocystaceae bacterium]